MKDGLASVHHGIGKDGDVMRGGKYAGVWRYTSQHTGVLVIDFSLNDAVAEGAVIDCGRNRRTPCRGRIESCVCHTQRAEDLALAETVKRFISNALQRYPKNDESDIAVGGLGAWIRRQWRCEGRIQQLSFCWSSWEQLFVCRQSERMGQQHVQSHFAAALILSRKFRHDGDYRHFQIEQTTLVKNHGDAGG